MTLDEAIEILKEQEKPFYRNPDLIAAVELGIEALKRILETRVTGVWAGRERLLGETEGKENQ